MTPVSEKDPAVIVSSDGHVGPLIKQQLRDYCPDDLLEEFDDFVRWHESGDVAIMPVMQGNAPNLGVAGHYDVGARLADMDRDGVAAEVLFHASLNGEPLPFVRSAGGGLSNNQVSPETREASRLNAAGMKIYNRWLADFCASAPERFIGLAYLPTWDIDASLEELSWARNAGLRGVNFPAPGRRSNLPYNHPDWEPFWAACADFEMPLTTHAGGAPEITYNAGPGGADIGLFEVGGFLSRRGAWWLTLSGVFERHPKLRLVLTEQWEGWWTSTLRDLDETYVGRIDPLPKRPSEYMRRNVFLGASFPSIRGAMEAVTEGYASQVMWGRDYPHPEGTWQFTEHPESEESTTRLALRHVFSHVPTAETRAMIGENAVDVYSLDRPALAAVAARIGALTGVELSRPIEAIPSVHDRCRAFRGMNAARDAESV